jgi:hypothetical protein
MSRTTNLVVALLIGVAGLAVSTVPASAVAVTIGGRVKLTSPQRIVDTRDLGGKMLTWILPVGLLSVGLSEPNGAALVDVRPCKATSDPDPSRNLALLLPGHSVRRSVVVGEPGMCIVSSEAAHLQVDVYGTIDATPSASGLQFVPDARPLSDAFMTSTASSIVQFGTVPTGASGVVLQLSGMAASPGFVVPCFGTSSLFTLDPGPAGVLPESGTMAFLPLSPHATSVCLASDVATAVHVSLVGWLSSEGPDATGLPPFLQVAASGVRAPGFQAVPPVRVLDTRNSIGRSDSGPLGAGQTLVLDVSDHITDFSTAVVMNVTATGPSDAGFLTAYPCDEPLPTASHLNYVSGQTVANLVTVPIASDGTVCIFTQSTTQVIADLAGTYEYGGGEATNPIAPTRIMDTRIGTGSAAGKIAGGTTTRLQVAGPGRAVPAGASAVTMNVTVNDPNGGGFLTVYPCSTEPPVVSNLNYMAGDTVPNLVTIKLPADGSVCFLSVAATHLIVDAAAWFGTGTEGFRSVTPTRVLDTRSAVGVPTTSRLEPGGVIVLPIADVLPDEGTAALLNITVTGPDSSGFVTAYPCDQERPTASNLNYVAGKTVPNLVSVKMSQAGTVCLYSESRTHLIADLAGYVTPSPDPWWTNVASS